MIARNDSSYVEQFVRRCEELEICFGIHFDGTLNYIMIFVGDEEPSSYEFLCEPGRIDLNSIDALLWLERCIQRQETLPKPKPGIVHEWSFDDAR